MRNHRLDLWFAPAEAPAPPAVCLGDSLLPQTRRVRKQLGGRRRPAAGARRVGARTGAPRRAPRRCSAAAGRRAPGGGKPGRKRNETELSVRHDSTADRRRRRGTGCRPLGYSLLLPPAPPASCCCCCAGGAPAPPGRSAGVGRPSASRRWAPARAGAAASISATTCSRSWPHTSSPPQLSAAAPPVPAGPVFAASSSTRNVGTPITPSAACRPRHPRPQARMSSRRRVL